MQESYHSSAKAKEIRKINLSPKLKLPPIHLPEASSNRTISRMPPQNITETAGPLVTGERSDKEQNPEFVNFNAVYENMMVNYFMPQQNVKRKF